MKKIQINSPIKVYSEIGQLRRVLVHRPGSELKYISPSNMEELLFSAILDYRQAQHEHDQFVKIMRDNGVEVVYIKDLFIETWNEVEESVKNNLIDQFIIESKTTDLYISQRIKEYLLSRSVGGMFDNMVSGITTQELRIDFQKEKLVTLPMPNMFFTRDPFATIGDGITINSMKYDVRRRETLIIEFIFNHHPIYKNAPKYLSRHGKNKIEGGDIFIYTENTLVIGISERTSLDAIVEIAKNIKNKKSTSFKKVIAIKVPHQPNLMHLDTWLTMVDENKFLYSPNVLSELKMYSIDLTLPTLKPILRTDSLEHVLESITGKTPILIPVANNYSQLRIDIETHFDATNFLTIKPGVVVGYDRNEKTIEALRSAGVEVLTFNGNQLSLGMGSARCMSMPLWRGRVFKKLK